MLEFLGTILMIGYIVFVGVYLYIAVSKYPSDHLMLKPIVVFLVLIISLFLLQVILQGCGIDLNIFEGGGDYYDRGGPY